MVNVVGTYSICGLPDVVYQSVPKLATPPWAVLELTSASEGPACP